MESTRPSNQLIEEFNILQQSDFWSCLPQQLQQGILTLLKERRNKPEETFAQVPEAGPETSGSS